MPTTAWRISKYDPTKRTAQGHFDEEDWTSVSDIGKVFAGQVLTPEIYLATEQAYIAVATALHVDSGSPALFVNDVEYFPGISPQLPGAVVIPPPDPTTPVLGSGLLDAVIRSCLRELWWCRLEADARATGFHFGYDFYMYAFGVEMSPETAELARRRKLFVEPFTSPYMERNV